MRRFGSLALLLVGSACHDDPCPAIETCDIRESACQERAARVAACLRGDDPDLVSVPVEVVDAHVYIEQAVRDAEGDPSTTPEVEAFDHALVLLGAALPDDGVATDIRAHYEQVAAFYSTRTRSVTVLDRGRPMDDAAAMALMVHEMTHAIQDERGALDSAQAATNWDMWLARRAMTEGDATLVGMRARVRLEGYADDEVDWDRWFDDYQRDMIDEALASTDLVRDSSLLFPYAWGSAYVYGVRQREGTDGVDALFEERAPNDTATIVGDDALHADLGKHAVPVMDAPWEPSSVSHLGGWLVARYLERLAGGTGAAVLRDALSVFTAPGEDGAPSVGALWRFEVPAKSQAEELARAVELWAPVAEGARLRAVAAGNEVIVSVEDGSSPGIASQLAWTAHQGDDLFFEEASAQRRARRHVSCRLSRASVPPPPPLLP